MVADIKSERWPASRRNGWPASVGIRISAIDVNVTPKTFEIRMRDDQVHLISLSLTRLEVHRMVEALSQRAEAAGWNIAVDATWLDPGQTEIVFN